MLADFVSDALALVRDVLAFLAELVRVMVTGRTSEPAPRER